MYILIEHMLADGLTKSLSSVKFFNFIKEMQIELEIRPESLWRHVGNINKQVNNYIINIFVEIYWYYIYRYYVFNIRIKISWLIYKIK